MLKLYNTLTRKIEEFEPLDPPKVTMYTCGPTVYDYQHIGNLRTMTLSDVLKRTLQANAYEVTSVRNITDIEDKIIKKAAEKGLSIEEFTRVYEKIFFEDLEKLNIEPVDVNPRATEHINEMVKYIQVLINKGLAYVEEDGSVYFDISEFPDYGKLSRIEKRELKSGTRTLSDEYTKDSIQDFALWKSVHPNEIGYDSPWGRGRPGWHIECSVMSQQYLGDTFDIHIGGIDLLFPHHENEIAQAEGVTGKQFVRFWIHGEFLLVEGQKMSKSLNNFYTLRDIEEKGFEPLALRYLYLTAHYRDKLNFTWKSLEASQNALYNLRDLVRDFDEPKIGCAEYEQRFKDAINNDLNLPQAVAVMWEMIRSDYPTSAKAQSLLQFDKVLGLDLQKYVSKKREIPEEVMKLVNKREQARENKDFEESDKLRKEIAKLGFEVEDTPQGPKVK
ncbi:MAG: Cysteine-tRNA ligase [Candidatus Daviesbacteria bacterium GW2011_GWA2_38_24]|uniref:Cysteine--tRNA ligase n=1 Tax=Candidatus Daviesbacteria bacterium GW2011_GWA2_38_24 TaxID=1618422 RepID=A0A0G0JE91_9BACT|nr:MAG: Cysteine-tRNA ligase [Candidatus Daviesbacteria bacterium GW2011_GWA2_38_24]KKQ80879.1 MAG: Cysteine-tRNA ligase [Candidatus Daviesbacteria bacterium GW2011_GWA1_38_7]OGE23146.1 MAG: cysteine--tRNA ligase [Candidatus Daviesbacteria bacterium RIFCSPHIGHO2_01_FULL_38_8]